MRITATLGLILLLLPTQVMAIVFDANFVQGDSYETGTPVGDQWNTFTAAVGTGAASNAYTGVTLSGSNDPTGLTCSDPAAANQIGTALSSVGASATVSCDSNTWRVGQCGDGQEISVNSPNICSCAAGYVLRPTINPGNSNWGGINTSTCNGPTQSIRLEFADNTQPSAIPTLSSWALVILAAMLGLIVFSRRRLLN